ncbi:hypothetical protein [Arthrobacter sp. SDTb3-6]|uniref:hypothetical protein n=1 Tax=Arthrobacter sp. SDTb3-6 TaxID=2713571 RepID=UPI00159E3007|nr:hypothetical protein [Arthrobacter sp. SDTb3-6]NVM97837.1 hypothetical protein [Arthrobacter sp. SDTb3-6]
MEQAASTTITGLLAQLGIAGIILAVLVAGAAWYLKTSKELREEKRGVISDLEAKVRELESEKSRLQRELYKCQFPGWRDDQ